MFCEFVVYISRQDIKGNGAKTTLCMAFRENPFVQQVENIKEREIDPLLKCGQG